MRGGNPGLQAEGSEDVAAGEGDWFLGIGVRGELLHAYIAGVICFGEAFEMDMWERTQEEFGRWEHGRLHFLPPLCAVNRLGLYICRKPAVGCCSFRSSRLKT